MQTHNLKTRSSSASTQKTVVKRLSTLLAGLAMMVSATGAGLAQGNSASKPVNDIKTPWAKQVLENRPLEPLNRELFVPQIYPETAPTVPAQGPAPTEEEVTTMLLEYLQDEFPNSRGRQKNALAVFNSAAAREKIPNPSLRAALVGLTGTIAEPAIDFILNEKTPEGLPKVKEAKFEDLGPSQPAMVLGDNTTQQMSILFNSRYQAENPFLFSQYMAHEALHSDPQVTDLEEVIALGLHTYVYIQQLVRHPELAGTGTELSRRVNSNALARFNAGQGRRLGDITNNNQLLFPGGALPFTSWFEQFEDLPDLVPTPGNALLASYLRNLRDRSKCFADEFNLELLFCILENQRGLDAKRLIRVAQALQLDTQQLFITLDDLDDE